MLTCQIKPILRSDSGFQEILRYYSSTSNCSTCLDPIHSNWMTATSRHSFTVARDPIRAAVTTLDASLSGPLTTHQCRYECRENSNNLHVLELSVGVTWVCFFPFLLSVSDNESRFLVFFVPYSGENFARQQKLHPLHFLLLFLRLVIQCTFV